MKLLKWCHRGFRRLHSRRHIKVDQDACESIADANGWFLRSSFWMKKQAVHRVRVHLRVPVFYYYVNNVFVVFKRHRR